MRLTTKLFLSTATLVTLGTAAVGVSTVAVNYSSEVKTLATAMNRDASLIDVTSYDALGDALAVGQESDVPSSIAFVSSGGLVTLIHDDGPKVSESLALELLRSKRSTSFEHGDFLARTLKLDTGGDLVMVSSLATIKGNLNRNLIALGLLYVGVLLLMLTLTWLALRKDMRSIKRLNAAATAIASGDLEATIPRKRGNSEIAELARSLDSMVDRLQTAISVERESKRSIESFIGDASHELRTPLTVIRGYSELLKTAKADQKFKNAALDKIVGEVDRMSRLVEDLGLESIDERAATVVPALGEAVDLLFANRGCAVARGGGRRRAGRKFAIPGERMKRVAEVAHGTRTPSSRMSSSVPSLWQIGQWSWGSGSAAPRLASQAVHMKNVAGAGVPSGSE